MSVLTAPRRKGAPPSGAHVLHPGDVACGERGDRLETLLGSCVAVVLTDPRRTIGAMCHIVHARRAPADARNDARYGDVALRTMHGMLRGRGIEPRLCEAYVYGGGNMFPDRYAQSDVGRNNIDWALHALEDDGVRVLLHDVGGASYRRLAWTIGPGDPEVTAVPV